MAQLSDLVGTTLSYLDGWTPVADTWTYASASTITVPSGAASKYSVGDKVKLTQTTPKYFYIISVADTVLTVTGGTDFTVANAAITSPNYSKVQSPLGFPQWFAYTPVWTKTSGTAPTLGNATLRGRFTITGRALNFNIYFRYGSTSAYTDAGVFLFSAPVAGVNISDAFSEAGNVTIHDDSVGQLIGLAQKFDNATKVYVLSDGAPNGISGTVPFTFTTDDGFNISAIWEI